MKSLFTFTAIGCVGLFLLFGVATSFAKASTESAVCNESGCFICKDKWNCTIATTTHIVINTEEESFTNHRVLQKISDLKSLVASWYERAREQLKSNTDKTASSTVITKKDIKKYTVTTCEKNDGLVPLYELVDGTDGQHFYTTSVDERDSFIYEKGFAELGIAAWLQEYGSTRTHSSLERYRFRDKDQWVYLAKSDSAVLDANLAFEREEGYMLTDRVEGAVDLFWYYQEETDDSAYTVASDDAVLKVLGYEKMSSEGLVCPPTPYISDNTILAVADNMMVIRGSGFSDTPNSEHKVVFAQSLSNRATVSAQSESVISWSDRKIVLKTPSSIDSNFTVHITNGNGYQNSNQAPLRVYRHTAYPLMTSATGIGNPLPIDLALNRSTDTLWAASEFTRGINSFDTKTKVWTYHEDPQPTNTAIFHAFGNPSRLSAAGEDVDIAADGTVWYTQGGAAYEQKGNGRVVALNSKSGHHRCYNIPLVGPSSFGMIYDEYDDVVYVSGFTHGDSTAPNYILKFKPAEFSDAQTSCLYDFKTPPPADLCTSSRQTACFKKIDLPVGHDASHLEQNKAGDIWFSSFYSSSIGHLDTRTEKVTIVPLPKVIRTEGHAAVLGTGPWSIAFDKKGDLWVNEYFESHFIKLDTSTNLTLCQTLTTDGSNPCMSQYSLIYYPDSSWNEDYVHSITIDKKDRLWFTTQTYPEEAGEGYLGMIDATGEIHRFPPLIDLGIAGGATGIVVDDNDDIWFLSYYAKRIEHLEFLD